MPTVLDLTITFDPSDDVRVDNFILPGARELSVSTSGATVYIHEDHLLAVFNKIGEFLFPAFQIEAFNDAHGHNVRLTTAPLLDEDVNVTLNGEVLFKGEVTP